MWNGEEVIVDGHPIRRGTRKGQYFVQSSSSHHIYEIDIINSSHPDCKGFHYRNTCIHWQLCLKDFKAQAQESLTDVRLSQMQTMSGKSIILWMDMFTDEDIELAETLGYIIFNKGKVIWL